MRCTSYRVRKTYGLCPSLQRFMLTTLTGPRPESDFQFSLLPSSPFSELTAKVSALSNSRAAVQAFDLKVKCPPRPLLNRPVEIAFLWPRHLLHPGPHADPHAGYKSQADDKDFAALGGSAEWTTSLGQDAGQRKHHRLGEKQQARYCKCINSQFFLCANVAFVRVYLYCYGLHTLRDEELQPIPFALLYLCLVQICCLFFIHEWMNEWKDEWV